MVDINDLPIMLKPEEAGELLRKSRKEIYNMAERGSLPGLYARDTAASGVWEVRA